jgi:methyltransferase type 12
MKSIWDFWANYYNKLWVQKYSLKPSRDKVIDIIKKTKIKNGDLLDMG